MIASGAVVKTCAQNMSLWAPDLRNLLLVIINSASDPSSSESIRALVTLSDQILNGIDLDHNGKIEAIAGECGAGVVYEYSYRMVDMPILPAGLSDQLTQVAGFTLFPTNASGQFGFEGTPGVIGTPGVNPTSETKPTKETKPPKDNPGGGNDKPKDNPGGGNDKPKDNPGGGDDKPPKEPKEK
jgi:hypothetical protein